MGYPQRGSTGTRILVVAVAFLAVAGLTAIRVAGTRGTARSGGSPVPAADAKPAPAFDGIAAWINSPPLTISSLKGKVVLIDFWTYSCINCLRTIPGLRALDARYRAAGLQIVGVHSPEFDFEKVQSNVNAAVKRLGVVWPVAMDNAMATWTNYRNSYWPHVYLIDRAGKIRYDHIGEGDEATTEDQVRSLLSEDSTIALPARVNVPEPSFAANRTPEIYAGYERGEQQRSIRNGDGYIKDSPSTYRRPSASDLAGASTDGGFFLEGTWLARSQFLVAKSVGKVLLPFYAKHAYVVAASDPSTSLRVLLDGKPVTVGEDMRDGSVHVGSSRLYELASLSSAGRHVLELDVQPGFQLFSFTFG